LEELTRLLTRTRLLHRKEKRKEGFLCGPIRTASKKNLKAAIHETGQFPTRKKKGEGVQGGGAVTTDNVEDEKIPMTQRPESAPKGIGALSPQGKKNAEKRVGRLNSSGVHKEKWQRKTSGGISPGEW